MFVPMSISGSGPVVIRAPTKAVSLLSLQREPSIDLLQAFVEHWKGITHYYIESTGGACSFHPGALGGSGRKAWALGHHAGIL